MKTKNYGIAAVVVALVIIIGIYLNMGKPSTALAPTDSGAVTQTPVNTGTPTTGTKPVVTGTTKPLYTQPAAPKGATYPIHINTAGPSVYYNPVNTSTSTTATSIIVSNPPTSTYISSPLALTGTAKGSWFFEGSFPVVLTDLHGKVLARTVVSALSDWMTTDFVPFSGNISFAPQVSGTKGVIIFKKDNPSGLAANDASIEIQVTFR